MKHDVMTSSIFFMTLKCTQQRALESVVISTNLKQYIYEQNVLLKVNMLPLEEGYRRLHRQEQNIYIFFYVFILTNFTPGYGYYFDNCNMKYLRSY